MNLNYTFIPEDLGGSAVPGCGTIHITEIESTLKQLSLKLNFDFNLGDLLLGSTGKVDYSGDIDIVLDETHYSGTPLEFFDLLTTIFGKENVAKNGNMIHLKYMISDYNPIYDMCKPRTGYVQVDFNFGNVLWEKFYHYSAGNASRYKGAHRNMAISAICSSVNLVNSIEVDTYNRPTFQVRWKYGPKGFIQVNRKSVKDKRSGVWLKKQEDTIVDGPHIDKDFILKTLFPEYHTSADLDSLENILTAIKFNYGMVDQERIYRQIARNFADWKYGSNFSYPEEIKKYIDDVR